MLYYDSNIYQNQPELMKYFSLGIKDESKNLGHCLLFWGPDIKVQCELALEIARLFNCSDDGNADCSCINCKWIKENTHPAVKIFTRLDFKDLDQDSATGKRNITVSQAQSIINELSITSDYHRVYIFCDRDEAGNLMPLNKMNFPDDTSNKLLKTFEEPPQNTTFIFLTNDKSDIISTVVSRAQSFFVPSKIENNQDFSLVSNLLDNYWNIERNSVLEFENSILALIEGNDPKTILIQMENYLGNILKNNLENKILYFKVLKDLGYVEEALRQLNLTPAMNTSAVIENLAFKMIL